VAQRTPEPIDYAPAESLFVAQLDMTHLRSSPYISYVNGWIQMLRGIAEAADGGRDLTPLLTAWNETDGLLVAFGQAPANGLASGVVQEFEEDTSQFVGVLYGHYGEGELEQWLRDFVDEDAELEPSMVDGHLVMRSTTENVFIAVMNAHTLVLGVHTDLEAALAIAGGAAPPHGTIDQLRAVATQAGGGQHTLDLALVATPAVRQLLSRADDDSSNDAMVVAMVETLDSLTGHMAFDDGIDLSVRVNTTNSLSAVAIAQELNNKLDEAASQPGLAMLGLDGAVRNTRARVDGTACVVELRLDDSTSRSLFERLQGLFQLLSSMANQPSESPEAAPDTEPPSLRNGELEPAPGQI